MAKQANTLGANKLARFALEKLSLYKVPRRYSRYACYARYSRYSRCSRHRLPCVGSNRFDSTQTAVAVGDAVTVTAAPLNGPLGIVAAVPRTSPWMPRWRGTAAAPHPPRTSPRGALLRVAGAASMAGAGRRLCSFDSLACLHLRRRAAAVVLPLPDNQPVGQPGGRPLHRVRSPDDALLL